MITLRINGELIETDEEKFYQALESLDTADESGIEVVGPDHLKASIEARINAKVNDDEEVWLLT